MASANRQSKKPSPVIPWRMRIALSFASAFTNYSLRKNGTIKHRLLGIFFLKTSASPNPVNGVKSFDITVDPSRNLWFRLFVPTTDEFRNLSSLPIIVFFHGGVFVDLSADMKMFDALCRRFARKVPVVVVSVNYRLAPEHRYPAYYDDGFDVLKFLDNEKNRGLLPENVNLSCCFLAGDSASGNLAHHVAKRASELTSSFDALKGFHNSKKASTILTRSKRELVDQTPQISPQATNSSIQIFKFIHNSRSRPPYSTSSSKTLEFKYKSRSRPPDSRSSSKALEFKFKFIKFKIKLEDP